MRGIFVAISTTLAAGCISNYAGSARRADPALLEEPAWRAERGVPVILQESRRDCGAAALAMVLAFFGDRIPPGEIVTRCAPAPGRGIRADALRDFAKSRGFDAFCLPAGRDDLEAELDAGRPILVGLVKPQMDGALPHYEVVVGLDGAGRRIATIDPARGLTVNSWEGFAAEWEPAGRLALVVGPRDRGNRDVNPPPGPSR